MNKVVNKFVVWMLIMVFAFGITAIPTWAAEQKDDIYRQNAENVLRALDILNDSYTDYEHEITRQEFADVAVRLINMNTVSGFEEQNDDSSISILVDRGFITGYEDGTYRPENIITGEEAIKIIVSMLGYWYPAEQKGGYPSGYINQAAILGITNKVKTNLSDSLKYGTLIDILYEVLDVDIMVTEYSGANTVIRVSEDETILSAYRNIYYGKGIVTSNTYTSLKSTLSTGKNQIKIDDVLYECDLEGAYEFIGYYVDYYYQKQSDDSMDILYIGKNNANGELTVYSEDIIGYKDDYFRYYDGNKEKKVKIDFGAGIILNNKFKSEINISDFCPQYGSVRFVDAKSDGNYETVIIENIELAVIGAAVIEEGRVFDKYTKKEIININDYDDVEVICDGKVYDDLSEVKSGDAVEIKKAAYDLLTIVICRERLPGKVESTVLDGDDKYITVNGEQRIITEYAAQLIKDLHINIINGSSYEFYLNTRGHIVGCELMSSSSKRYGYIISFSSETDMTGDYFIKILDQSDERLVLKVAETFKVDGDTYKNNMQASKANAVKNALDNHLVVYTINLNGKIISIDTEEKSAKESNESLTRLNTVENADYRKFKSGTGFGGSVLVDDDTIVFVIPTADSENSKDYGFYRVLSGADFIVNGKYSLTGYNSVGYEYISDAVVVHDSGNKMTRSPYDKKPMFINNIGMMVDEDDDIKIELRGYIDGVETSVGVIDNREKGDGVPKLSPGDIVDLVESNNGDVIFGKPGASTFLVDLDEQGKLSYLYTGSSSYSSTYLYRFKGVHRVDGKYAELGDPNDILNDSAYELINTSAAVILVYDKDIGKFRTGTENDIISYEMSPDNYSKVFLLSSNSFFYLAVYND